MTDEQYPPESLLTVEEAAVGLGLTPATVRALMRAGHLPATCVDRRGMVPLRALVAVRDARRTMTVSAPATPVAIIDQHELHGLGLGLYQLRWPKTGRLVQVEASVYDFATDETRREVSCVRLARVMFPHGLAPKDVEAYWQRRDGLMVVIARCPAENYPCATRDDMPPVETVDPAVPHLEPPVAPTPKRKTAPKRRSRKAR